MKFQKILIDNLVDPRNYEQFWRKCAKLNSEINMF